MTWGDILPSSPRLLQWGRLGLLVGGVLGISANFLSVLLLNDVLPSVSPGYKLYEDRYLAERLLNAVYNLLGPVGGLLISAGLFCLLYALPARRSASLQGLLAGAGVFLACLSAVASVGLATYKAFSPIYAYST